MPFKGKNVQLLAKAIKCLHYGRNNLKIANPPSIPGFPSLSGLTLITALHSQDTYYHCCKLSSLSFSLSLSLSPSFVIGLCHCSVMFYFYPKSRWRIIPERKQEKAIESTNSVDLKTLHSIFLRRHFEQRC